MGMTLRIAGVVWIGIGLINVYLVGWDTGMSDRALISNMMFYGLPGLLLLILGSMLRKKS